MGVVWWGSAVEFGLVGEGVHITWVIGEAMRWGGGWGGGGKILG